MKIKAKRIMSWAIIVMLLSMLQCVSVDVLAEDGYQATNPYVLSFGAHPSSVDVYAQFSRLVPTLTYNGVTVEGYSIIFGLTDDYNNIDFQSLYCTDMPVDAMDESYYQRLNLEDSTYASAVANRLRGVLLGTYPYITVEKLVENSGITGLTKSEAIVGSQLAIWQLAHGDNVKVTDFISFYGYSVSAGSSAEQKELDNEGKAYLASSAEEQAASKQRIEQLYRYLLNLPQVAASKTVASSASFVSKSETPTVTDNGDGTCNVTVETTVDVQLDGGDSLVLTAHMAGGEYYTSQPLSNGSQTYTLTIPNVPAANAGDTVTLAIDGTQYAKDVYLVDADGIRGVSQSMIGVLEGTLPVHAETDVSPDRVLNIQKTDGNGDGLENISFDVYYVGSLDAYLDGTLGIGTKPTEADIKAYGCAENLVGTLTTDASGYASLNFGTQDGVYLVKELQNDAIAGTVDPFFVTLPDYSRGEGDSPAYTITAQPKNTVWEEKIDIKKDVTKIDNEEDTYDVGEDHSWIIRTSIPRTLSSGKAYTITDTLDARLTYQKIEKVVLADENDDEVLTLTAERDYTVSHEKRTETEQDHITVSLTSQGMKTVAQKAGDDYDKYELRTYLVAKINQKASMGENIPNQAYISFTNNVGKRYSDESDIPKIHTGGVQLKKADQRDNEVVLSGATFAVYREATAYDLAENVPYEEFTIGETIRKLIKVSFYPTSDLTGEKGYSLTTDEYGMGYIYGLAYGEYYLVETEAPAGYRKPMEPLAFTVNSESHLVEKTIVVENYAGTELPSTGGVGTGIFTGLGLCLVIGASVVLITRKRMA